MADNPDVNQPNPQNHLLIKKTEDDPPQESFTLYADDNTFPQRSRILQAPGLVNTLTRKFILNSIDGWQFFYGEYVDRPDTKWAVKWNPSTNECDDINVTPNEGYICSAVGFGVHPDAGLKLVKISFRTPDDQAPNALCDVDVYTLATGVRTNVITDGPFMLSARTMVECSKVFVGGVLYFRASDGPVNQRTNYFYSFNLETNEFREVHLPVALAHTPIFIQSADVNGSLGLLGSVNDGVCDVWTYEEGANDFAGPNIIGFAGNQLYGDVLGFRNNGQAVLELRDHGVANIGLYDFETGNINGDVGINGNEYSFKVRPYFGNVAYD